MDKAGVLVCTKQAKQACIRMRIFILACNQCHNMYEVYVPRISSRDAIKKDCVQDHV